jgi:hypothetical protein
MMPLGLELPTNSDAIDGLHLAFLCERTHKAQVRNRVPLPDCPPPLVSLGGRPDIIDEGEDAEESIRSTIGTEERKAAGQNQSQLTE